MDKLYEILYRFMEEICPIKEIISKHKPVPWMNNEIKNLMERRKIMYNWWKINRKHQSADLLYNNYNIRYLIIDI